MKSLKSVEENRKQYHENKRLNTVHRSSLLVPKIRNNSTYISFLNHYLIKRGYDFIVMKILPFDSEGNSGDALTFDISKAKVYTYCLENLFSNSSYNCYQIEFFTSDNLFIPFPAVMINHIGKGSINTVHAYNRILNDPREMEKVGEIEVLEASIDLCINERCDTFFIIQSGIIPLKDEILEIRFISHKNPEKEFTEKIKISMPKMSIKKINLSSFFPINSKLDLKPGDFTVKVKQPYQPIFYGRLLVGIEEYKSGCFTGNHSYYDNSTTKEYFKNKCSYKTMPYFQNYINKLHIYPIMSGGQGSFTVKVNIEENEKLNSYFLEKYNFNNNQDTLIIEIDKMVSKNFPNKNIKTFTLIYEPKEKYLTPSRINYQLIYGLKGDKYINSSINVSLFNDDVFLPKGKGSQVWCQLLNEKGYESHLGICFMDKEKKDGEEKCEIKIDIYDESGHIKEITKNIGSLDSFIISNSKIESQNKFLWFFVKSKKPNLLIETFSFNKNTGFASGEHSFGSW